MKLAILSLAIFASFQSARTAKIAIVGGGVGGTASAFFLRELLRSRDSTLQLDIYEPGKVGGRLSVAQVGGRSYEVGGAVIHPRNKHMINFIKHLGLSQREGEMFGRMGLYDGSKFLFEESNSRVFSFLKMMWHYGVSNMWSLNSLTKLRLDYFDRIYEHQERGTSFETVTELLVSMHPMFASSTNRSLKAGCLASGLQEPLISELVAAAMRVNYGQYIIEPHEFVGFVAVAGADSNLWAVKDGNYKVPEGLLKSSGATLIPNRVRKIHVAPKDSPFSGYVIESSNKQGGLQNSSYDAVIVATPLTSDYREKIVLPPSVTVPKKNMHRLLVTLVSGKVNYATFGITEEHGINEIFYIAEKPWFNSVSKIYPVDGSTPDPKEPHVFKVFSNAPLTEEQLSLLFSKRDTTEVIDWFSYPSYDHDNPLEDLSFVLRPGLFYLNAIEWAASAMEMSALSAKNVALLAAKFVDPKAMEEERVSSSNDASKLEL